MTTPETKAGYQLYQRIAKMINESYNAGDIELVDVALIASTLSASMINMMIKKYDTSEREAFAKVFTYVKMSYDSNFKDGDLIET